MKRVSVLLMLVCCLLLGACNARIGGKAASGGKDSGSSEVRQSSKLAAPLNQMEYVEYQNIFFQKQADSFVGQHVTKTGIFVPLEDNWAGKTRYYVWGYYDQTKCCDWQWEFVPIDTTSLPPAGSLVQMTGTLEYNEAALDKYWYRDASVSLDTEFAGETCEIDLSLMDATLERVQLLNLLHAPEQYEGKTVRLYGRVKTPGSIQHPYYDNVWSLDFVTDQNVPAIGTVVLVTGTWRNGTLTDATVAETKDS